METYVLKREKTKYSLYELFTHSPVKITKDEKEIIAQGLDRTGLSEFIVELYNLQKIPENFEELDRNPRGIKLECKQKNISDVISKEIGPLYHLMGYLNQILKERDSREIIYNDKTRSIKRIHNDLGKLL
jgi:hypothetical protein